MASHFEGEPTQDEIYQNTVKAFKEAQAKDPVVYIPPSRESDEGDFYQGVVVGLVVATLFWVIFMTVLWLILR